MIEFDPPPYLTPNEVEIICLSCGRKLKQSAFPKRSSECLACIESPEDHLVPEEYRDYINSKEWRKKRQQAFREHGRACEICGEKNGVLHVHHLTYERLGFELMEDLQILCEPCHVEVHRRPNAYLESTIAEPFGKSKNARKNTDRIRKKCQEGNAFKRMLNSTKNTAKS